MAKKSVKPVFTLELMTEILEVYEEYKKIYPYASPYAFTQLITDCIYQEEMKKEFPNCFRKD